MSEHEATLALANRIDELVERIEQIVKREQIIDKAQLRLSESFTALCEDIVPRLEALERTVHPLGDIVGEHPADAGAIPENCPEVGETVRCIRGYEPEYLPQEDELYVVKSLKHGSTFPSDAAVNGWQVSVRECAGWYPVERFAAVPAGNFNVLKPLVVDTEALTDTLMGKRVNDPLYDLLEDPPLERIRQIVEEVELADRGDALRKIAAVLEETRAAT
jgi:hypothetical protein